MGWVKFCRPNANILILTTYALVPYSDRNRVYQVDIRNRHTRKPP